MARRKVIEPEIMPAGSGQPKTKTVKAKHKIEYEEPMTVPIEDATEDDPLTYEDYTPNEIEAKRKRKTSKDEREELRRDMDKIGVAPMSRLRLTIEKYKHGDSLDLGTSADKAYCTKYTVTKEHILSDDFLDVARKYGPGRYWFTLRLDNKIVRQWDRVIDGPQNGQIMHHANPDDPTSPQISIHMPENGAAPIPSDPFKEAERALGLVKKYSETFGLQTQANAPQRSEDEILAGALLKQPAMLDNVVGSLVKRFGKNGSGDDDPSWTSVAMKAIETGQATTIVQTLIREIVAPFRNIWSQPNGQTQMAQAPIQNHGTPNQNQGGQSSSNVHAIQDTETQPQGATNMAQAGAPTDGQQQPTPADHALMIVVNDCARRIPPQVTFTNLITFADEVNKQAPAYTIDGWIRFFADMPVDGALEFVKTLPNGPQVVALPHARAWTQELQKLFKENQAEESEAA